MKHVKHFEAFEPRETNTGLEIYQDNFQISPVYSDAIHEDSFDYLRSEPKEGQYVIVKKDAWFHVPARIDAIVNAKRIKAKNYVAVNIYGDKLELASGSDIWEILDENYLNLVEKYFTENNIENTKKEYFIKRWGEFNESLGGMSTDINQAIKNASELVGKELDDKNVVPELRDKIENLLQQGDTDLADELTDLKKQIENNED